MFQPKLLPEVDLKAEIDDDQDRILDEINQVTWHGRSFQGHETTVMTSKMMKLKKAIEESRQPQENPELNGHAINK